jgi:hypothetical protein
MVFRHPALLKRHLNWPLCKPPLPLFAAAISAQAAVKRETAKAIEMQAADRELVIKRGVTMDWIADDYVDPLLAIVPLHALRIHYAAGKLPGWFTLKLGSKVFQTNFALVDGITVLGDFRNVDVTLEDYIMMKLTATPRALLRVRKEDVLPN